MQRNTFIKALRAFGIVRVNADFDGEGDSGTVTFNSSDGLSREAAKIPMGEVREVLQAKFTPEEWADFTDGHSVTYTSSNNLEDLIEHELYSVLALTQVDWINNDGGFGTIEILPFAQGPDDTQLGTITIEMHERYMSTTDSTYKL